MKILSGNKEKEVIVITYFQILDDINNEYILYADIADEKTKNLYLSNVIYYDDRVELVTPKQKDLPYLKEIMKNFFEQEVDVDVFFRSKYKYIDIDKLKNEKVKEVDNKKIIIQNKKYYKLLSCKYLTYPSFKVINVEEIEKEGYDKNNSKVIPYSLLAITLYYLIMLIAYAIKPVTLNNLFSVNGMTITMWSLVVLLISMSAYNFEDREFKESFSFVFLFLLIFLILLMAIQNKVDIINCVFISLIYTIIFVVPYASVKRISFYVINKFRCRNYATYYCVYILPFFMIILSLIGLYNKYLYNLIHLTF